MIIQDVINHLEALAPLAYAEDFDNVGLLVGNKSNKVTGILVTLDTLEAVVDEAIEANCNMIVSFHPIIFKGLKKITGKNYVERVVLKAIKHDIAIFSIHTALDNAQHGVNDMICNQLQLTNKRILIPQSATIKKLTTYVPKKEANQLRTALFNAGAGNIGNYSNCSFNVEGQGTYKGNEDANPTLGKKGENHTETETKITVTFAKHLQNNILSTLFKTHSYEEVAYEITTIENKNQNIGIGMIGEFAQSMHENQFLNHLKTKMNTKCVRHSALLNKNIKRVAVLGGSGSFAINAAKTAGADAFITADLKYHDFFSAENTILLADIGHYESEQYTKNLLVAYLTKKITNFAIILSKINTNPVKYF
ncbi:Nif3-like dinuclear metal center hexameric protein [Algibacter amylolyticus]|uniref:GTP cyclohydrolase 1 type 2 homolog n=1 Tax=Algibacter amylolyticus TaxID=1608400 RepID=A0A5M7B7D7_9FLAO|nr:Nif3-like dinuclear metal center hexameric protein [Algibacter amylolyticus]KAA5824137.1 Nif3-like dinuclear metal center hexameric protein [Algibacter amylolyticus]MBB5269695.1 dinuclear metal center YbgI/SA1388 family protein [Algibacter amylolyticus]TSJ74614.1 Nif3-like dinuclear metal center hexameric protein [Algibacter amylolyticus]